VTPWLAVVGIGEDGLEGLAPVARTLIETAEVLVGGERHLAMVPAGGAERLAWASPIERTIDEIAARRGRRVTVLATGDPMFFGIGVTLARRFDIAEMTIVPAVGAVQLACARLGWAEAEIEPVTLVGRPLEALNLHLRPGARLVILSEDRESPEAVATALRAKGFGPSRIAVFERMGSEDERRIEGIAEGWSADGIADLNTIAVDCRAAPGASALSRAPGLPDEAFVHDGQLTKREVRAVTVAALAPMPNALLWDVGAGCGSVAIEWLRAERGARAVAVERNPERAALIARNAAALGVPGLGIVTGEAPGALEGLEAPDAVFVGGGASGEGLLEACWEALSPSGRLVANAVTIETEAALARFGTAHGGELVRLAVSRMEEIGELHGWRPMRAVTQLRAVKPSGTTP
jgi:precorrin-6Y C5,15-methyltransferase (decarboxylating)